MPQPKIATKQYVKGWVNSNKKNYDWFIPKKEIVMSLLHIHDYNKIVSQFCPMRKLFFLLLLWSLLDNAPNNLVGSVIQKRLLKFYCKLFFGSSTSDHMMFFPSPFDHGRTIIFSLFHLSRGHSFVTWTISKCVDLKRHIIIL